MRSRPPAADASAVVRTTASIPAQDLPGARETADTPARLEAVWRDVIACEACPRLREYCERIAREKRAAYRHETYWARPVPGFGDPRARLLVLGLAPAAHGANRTGRMFTGDGAGGSGDFLFSAMHRTGFASQPTSRHRDDGLTLRDAFVTAPVRCAPPDNKPTPDEQRTCFAHLVRELAALPDIRVVVALGRIASDTYYRWLAARGLLVRPRPLFGHLRVFEPPGRPDLPTLVESYHPSRQNTQTGRLTPPMLDAVFVAARERLGARVPRGRR